ncbi:MAG TPA: glycosyltransferase [Methylotenera sp.]|nr:glycosyltransferase [Methylotenera sp.]HPH06041.1 glycosyltransferase [Methylotenera sp.]HPN00619.1 glycosyltransferase [Methylotenera sp.]
MIRIFIGYDPRETVAYYVLNHSIIRHASQPVAITPLSLGNLGKLMTRERNALQSTDFSFSRFLTPYLSNYEGWSIFMDCDMLFMDDIAKLWALRNEEYAVQVVKHDHQPRESIKFLNAPQTPYQKKNWSSVILFNNAKCRALTPEYVNTASGLELHQFKWLENDDLIGEIPARWNHLVGYERESNEVSNAHYTLGGPYFNEFTDCEFSKEWFAERELMLHADQR